MKSSLDKDLQELVNSFSGYGIEPWMTSNYKAMALRVQQLRNGIRRFRDSTDMLQEDLFGFLPENKSIEESEEESNT